MVCYLALVLETALQKKLQGINPDLNYRKVFRDLAKLHAVKVSFEGQDYLTRNELTGEAYAAFKALGTRPPLHMQPIITTT